MTPEEKRKHNKRQNIISLLILVVGFIFIVAERDALSQEIGIPQSDSQKEESQDNIWTLKQESVSEEMEFYGSLQASRESNLSAKVSGRISSINVSEGDVVKTGQLLAYLAPDQYGISYRTANENYNDFEEYRQDQESYWDKEVKIAEEFLDTVKEERDYTKTHDPDRTDILDEEVDEAEAQLKSAKRQRDAQDESLNQQSDNFSGDRDLAAQYVTDTKVMSPYNGVVTKKYLENGEVVAAGQPVIAVADVSSYKVVVQVPDVLVNQLFVGQSARVTLDGISGQFSAKVTNINPKVDPVAKKIEVEVTLDTVPPNAKTDMFARVVISFPARASYFVPDNFVFSGFSGPYVILADGKEQPIERISEKDGKTEITFEGIADGIKIVRNANGPK